MEDSLSRSGQGAMLAPFKAVDGIISVPGYAFATDPSMGFWSPAAGTTEWAIAGATHVAFDAANQLQVYRDHGAGIQKFTVSDTFTEQATSDAAFDDRFGGFEDTGLHEEYDGDLDLIVVNSLYAVGTVTNAPSDYNESNAGFLHTLFYAFDSEDGVQIIYGMHDSNEYKQWMRVKLLGTWQPWVLVVNGQDLVFDNIGVVNVTSHMQIGALGSANQNSERLDIVQIDSANTVQTPIVLHTLGGSGPNTTRIGVAVASDGIRGSYINSTYDFGSVFNTSLFFETTDSGGNVKTVLHLDSEGQVEAKVGYVPVATNALTPKDYVDALTGSGDVFDEKWDGFPQTGRHEEFSGDLDTILKNSRYAFEDSTVTNAPSDMNGQGFITTQVYFISDFTAMQIIWGPLNQECGKW